MSGAPPALPKAPKVLRLRFIYLTLKHHSAFGSAASMIAAFSNIHINSMSVFNHPEITSPSRTISCASRSNLAWGVQERGHGHNLYIESSSVTEYHLIGTNSMLPLEYGGVVNTSLVVYGTANMSIVPLHVFAHTMATTYGVAERAADLIKATYGGANTSTSGSTSHSSPSLPPLLSNLSNPDPAASTSTTGSVKFAIAAGSAVAAIAAIAASLSYPTALMILRRRANRNRGVNSRAAVSRKEDHWYADDILIEPSAPCHHSALFSADSFATGMHSDNQQHVQYSQVYYEYSAGRWSAKRLYCDNLRVARDVASRDDTCLRLSATDCRTRSLGTPAHAGGPSGCTYTDERI
ncbi:hypothetical protein GGX14DRAFT_559367 [Mycena pura]|uniref:Uncharacterized protein n=1 Tax=Mycena pura TaxID=153505 RepID=A0AAD6VRD3_9AGAR|nr:hypothetical protein GGX14DRAFT_559367 [Mycena pura]